MPLASIPHDSYLASTLKMRQAMNELEGMIRGIVMDGHVNGQEIDALAQWLERTRPLAAMPPFQEFVATVARIVADPHIDEGDKSDLMWLFSRLVAHNQSYSGVTSDLQRLEGILAGVMADGVIHERERVGFEEWAERCRPLRSVWPYDELTSLLDQVLADGRIDPRERDLLLAKFRDVADQPSSDKSLIRD
ncbi:MAG: hypothetical protein U0939_03245 [Pirellulales bacterium]